MATTADRVLAKAFELRMIVAILFSVYGVVCIVWGIGFSGGEELKKAAGINVNLWAGIGMLVFGVAFGAWAFLKPLEEERSAEDQEKSRTAGDQSERS